MGLKKKKGFAIETKSHKAKLLRNGINHKETRGAFNRLVAFYFDLVNKDPSWIDVPRNDGGGWRFYELLTIGENPEHPLPEELFNCPSCLKRAAIRKAIGAWRSWCSNYLRWKKRPPRHKHHKPPVQPRKFNFSTVYDKGMWKDLDEQNQTVMLKVLVNSQWKWVKFSYKGYEIDSSWVKGQITVVNKKNHCYLVFALEKYVSATGGTAKVMSKSNPRVMGVDLDLDNHAAIVSILEIEANRVREVARHFIKNPKEIKLRKRDLGKIARKMRDTGLIHKDFCRNKWNKLKSREKEMGYAVGRKITELARGYGCDVIVFEHLQNLKPQKGKYSKRSNQKRSYWLKSKIYKHVKRVAYQDYGILTNRVNPRNTSRLDPWGEEVARQSNVFSDWEREKPYQPGATWVMSLGHYSYIAHSGINAARNIALKAIARYRTNPVFIRIPGKA